jgi:hypothetical protein
VEEVREAWTWRRRRCVVSTAVPRSGGEGRADDAVLEHFDMEEERGADVEAHTEDGEEGAWWRRTWRRSGRRWVCGEEMTGLGFRGWAHLTRRIVAMSMMMSSTSVTTYELSTHIATMVMPVATVF